MLIGIYCGLILMASVLGGWVPIWVRLTHTRLQLASSFIGGLMLGVGMLHLLPHGLIELQAVDPDRAVDRAVQWFLGGFLAMFFIQRFMAFHKHDVPSEVDPAARRRKAMDSGGGCEHDHSVDDHGHGHEHGVDPGHDPSEVVAGVEVQVSAPVNKGGLRWAWSGAALGLTLHTVINGMVLAAAVEAEQHHAEVPVLAGLATFLVIFLHKPFDALTIGTLMAAGGWSKRARHLINFGFALLIPVGVGLFHLGFSHLTTDSEWFLGCALAFAAGSFFCIAASDLLPELHFHRHDRIALSVALMLGIGLALIIGIFEGGHVHGHEHEHDHGHGTGGEEHAH